MTERRRSLGSVGFGRHVFTYGKMNSLDSVGFGGLLAYGLHTEKCNLQISWASEDIALPTRI